MLESFFGEVASFFTNTFSNPLMFLLDLLDIAIISVLVYIGLRFIRDTRAAQLLRGIILLIVLLQITKILNLTGSNFILNQVLEFGVLAMLIVFQPELRSVLESIGRKGFNKISFLGADSAAANEIRMNNSIDSLCDAVANLSATKTGALIVFEKDTKIGEIIKTGITINAEISKELVMNVFYPKAPLHDGAMIIRNFEIIAAGCFLPLSTREVASDLGTRHRAAIGVTEVSDSLVVVVSEETGIISIASQGILTRRISPDSLKTHLTKSLMPVKEEKNKKKDFFSHLWRGKKK